MKWLVLLLAFVVSSAVSAAEKEREDTVYGLGREQLANTVGCLARNTAWLVEVPQVLAAEGDRAAVQSALERVNARLPDSLRDAPDAIKTEAEALSANPPASIARYNGLRMEICAQRFGIPLNRRMVARCYEVISFMNAMRVRFGESQSPEAFADIWVPVIARSPEDLARLKPAMIELFGAGPLPPVKEFGLYLTCVNSTDEAQSAVP